MLFRSLLPRRCKRRFRFRRRGTWGALLPYTPSGTGCERVHTLSRSPGAVRSEVLVSGGTGGRRASACGTFASAAVCTKISFLTKQARDALRSSALLLPRRCKRRFRFRRRGTWGALLPYTPSDDGGERGASLSRSPGAVLVETFVSDDAGCSPDGFCFRRRGRGVLCSPTPPWVTAARGVRPSRALPGIL